jgi:uncharacterized protein (DUF2336 family)
MLGFGAKTLQGNKLIQELEDSIAKSPSGKRVDHLRRVTDLFLRDAQALNDEQIELFDVVIARLATAIETSARIELAERLAGVGNAPRGVVRSLAHDEISVARPILARSERLSDDDLVAVALAKGRDHMLAISERCALTEPVTDILVKRGDRNVVHSVAGNPGARFSEDGMAALVDRSRADDALQSLLGQRNDISDEQMRQLVAIAKETARRRLGDSMPEAPRPELDHAVEIGSLRVEAAVVPGQRDYTAAMQVVENIAASRALTEQDVLAYASEERFEECVCAISLMAGLSLNASERLFRESEAELLLVVAKAQEWSWPTVRKMITLRTDGVAQPHLVKRAHDTFNQLKPITAQRVVHFLKVREASQKRAAEIAAGRQIRSNVR